MNASPFSAHLFAVARTMVVATALAGAAVTAGLTLTAIGMQLLGGPAEHAALVADYRVKPKGPALAVVSPSAAQKVRVARSDF